MACGRFEDAARDILQEGVDWLTERGLHAQGHFAFGHPIDEIASLADSLKVDLVVVGHRCRSGLARWWMGAGNTPLLDRVSCSILVAVCQAGESADAEEDAAHAAKPVKTEVSA
jgi:nucleotide-binding universal stress UspA family protein